MTLAAATGRTEARPCPKCSAPALHREVVAQTDPPTTCWLSESHTAPCGLPCMNGARSPKRTETFHGRGDHCPNCGWLRVVPEVVAEYRTLAASMRDTSGALVSELVLDVARRAPSQPEALVLVAARLATVADALSRSLDEVERLRREREDIQGALERAREEVTELRGTLFDVTEARDEAIDPERTP
jgi:hypothetical protein